MLRWGNMSEENLTPAQGTLQAWNTQDYEVYDPIPIENVRMAQRRIKDVVVRTPLVRLNVDDAPAEIYLKLENLQPTGAFKLRGAMNIMRQADPEQVSKGVWAVSSGNKVIGDTIFGSRDPHKSPVNGVGCVYLHPALNALICLLPGNGSWENRVPLIESLLFPDDFSRYRFHESPLVFRILCSKAPGGLLPRFFLP